MNAERLALRKLGIRKGEGSEAYQEAVRAYALRTAELQAQYNLLSDEARSVKEEDARYHVTLVDVQGREKNLLLSQIVRLYPANGLSMAEKLGVYFSRWKEFLTEEPREANTEGGVLPAIFGTFAMTILMAVAVAPFGVMTALYLREYARQGKLVSVVRICVNNLAGVPSIVYGVFGLGFFAYICGGTIDQIFYSERLPNPTFGTGGLLWSSLTLALLTVPVVIVATEEALAAVPQSMREGSLACGASKWQTIKYIILPRAMPGIMTGLILAMARGAGEVAPLMLVGVVKIAPELPIDQFFPFIHFERSFMHLGFHIFDVGFQSRNSEAGKPMVFVTTLLLISLVAMMNAMAIMIRNRLKRRFMVGHF
jgi:phosphate transport system permease protein